MARCLSWGVAFLAAVGCVMVLECSAQIFPRVALAERGVARQRGLLHRREGKTRPVLRPEGLGALRDRPEGIGNRPLYLGDTSGNYTRADCVWRRDESICPDQDISLFLYTSEDPTKRVRVNEAEADWLRLSGWNHLHNNVLLVHGYAGGDGKLPTVILRDAYLKNGSYNVFVMDWGDIATPPCYPAAVHNLKLIAKCAAQTYTFLRTSGVPEEKTTCVGHSLGAHLCGLMSQALQFRMHRIIALDPARPLIRMQNKLGSGDAERVQVIHTNAGHYGEAGRLGQVDFCVNGGRVQPFCEDKTNVALCSHMRSVCYLAESINSATSRQSLPCSRRCPTGSRPASSQQKHGPPVLMGEHTPDSVKGTYCLSNLDEPYCPLTADSVGDPRCCSDPGEAAPGLPAV